MKNLFLMFMVLCVTSSFREAPVSFYEENSKETITTSIPVGGAYLVFAGKYGGEIKKSELTGQRELQVDGCAKGSKIFTFTLEVYRGSVKSTFTADSNMLTREMITRLQSLAAGDSFEFKSMKAYLPNGKDIVNVHADKFIVV